jgi:hypothetical protein
MQIENSLVLYVEEKYVLTTACTAGVLLLISQLTQSVALLVIKLKLFFFSIKIEQ